MKEAMRRTAILLALTSLQMFGAVAVSSAETWTWFRSVSTGTEWWSTGGKGDVDLSGSLFKATLRDGEDQTTRLALQGSVSGGLVRARVTVLESDAPVAEVSGRLKRLCWSKGGGREILILTNGEQVVGLFRELDPSRPCKAS
jgi:hypothetical protein